MIVILCIVLLHICLYLIAAIAAAMFLPNTNTNTSKLLFVGTVACINWVWHQLNNCIVFLCCINATPISGHGKVVFEFYINSVKMVVVALYFWGVRLCIVQALNDQNTLIVQSALPSVLRRIRGYAYRHQERLIHHFDQHQAPLLMHVI